MMKRLDAGEPADAVILTRRFFDAAVKTGKVVGGSRTEVGKFAFLASPQAKATLAQRGVD